MTIPNHSPTIALLGSFPPLRGISGYCQRLAEAVDQNGPVTCISFQAMYPSALYPGGRDTSDSREMSIQGRNLTVNRSLTWYNPLTWLKAGCFTRADLLHAQWWSLPLAPIYWMVCLGFKLRHKPVVITVHNVRPHEASRLFVWASRILFKLGDRFIVHTRRNRDQMQITYGIPKHRIRVIHHGPLEFEADPNGDRNEIRRRLGFEPADKIVLVFGTIRPYKGIITALKAISRVREENPDCRLLIAGQVWSGWEPYARCIREMNLEQAVKTHLRYIPDRQVSDFFEAADLVLLPYDHFDSQSGVGLAAVAFAKPMIVTDVGGLPELVPDHRFVVAPRNPEAMATAIAGCLKHDELDRMAADSAKVAQKMSWQCIGEKTWNLYRSLLDCSQIPAVTGAM